MSHIWQCPGTFLVVMTQRVLWWVEANNDANIHQYTEQFPPIGNYLAQTISIAEVDNKKPSFNLQYIRLTFYLLYFQFPD